MKMLLPGATTPPLDPAWCDANDVDPHTEIFNDGSFGPNMRMVATRGGWETGVPLSVIGRYARVTLLHPFKTCNCTGETEYCWWCVHLPAEIVNAPVFAMDAKG